jgi:hypothetical protein
MTDFVAVLDACVLVNACVRDALLVQAESPALYLPRWSRGIIQEVSRTLSGPRFNITPGKVSRLLEQLHLAFPEAPVTDYDALIPAMENDHDDRHVLAAAVKCGAQTIVTFNLKHFRDEHLGVWGIEAQSPDSFLTHQYHLDPKATILKLHTQASRIGWDIHRVIEKLAAHTPEFSRTVAQQITRARPPRLSAPLGTGTRDGGK